MVSTISTNALSLSYCSYPHLVKAGGVYYAFYMDNTDKFIKYRTSPDGVTWSDPVNASLEGNTGGNFAAWSVFYDGSYIYLGYWRTVAGNYLCVRRGTPAIPIVWNAPVNIVSSNNTGTIIFCKTTNHLWIATSPSISDVHVYESPDHGASWNLSLESAASRNYPHIASLEQNGVDRVMITYENATGTSFFYRTFDGSAWSGEGTVGEKAAALLGPSFRDLWAANGEVHFVYLTASAGSGIRYRRYTTSWQDYVTVDANTNVNLTISNNGDKLRVFYRRYSLPTAIFYREMNYTTHAFGDEQTLVSGLPTTLGTPSSEKEATDFYDELGVTWREGAAAPYTYKFEALTIGSATPSTVGPPSFYRQYPWLKTRPVPREILRAIIDYYKVKVHPVKVNKE